MTQPIDIAYVELEARGEEDAARDIKKALDKIARDVAKLSKQIEQEFSEASRDIEQEMTQAGSILTKEAVRQRAEWKKTGTALALAMKEASESAENSVDDFADEAVRDMDRIARSAARAAVAVRSAGDGRGAGGGGGGGGGDDGPDIDIGRRDRDIDGISGSLRGLAGMAGAAMSAVKELAGSIGDTLTNSAQKAAHSLGSLVGTISSVLGPIGSAIASAGMLGVALMLLPIIIPVIAALSQLSGLLLMLPGTVAVLAAAIVPLVMSFQGIGTAVSALASGDLEKIDKAMQDLAPSARKFAVEVFKLKDEMKSLRMAVQGAFFDEFNGSLTTLVNNTLPMLKNGLSDVSGALGRMGAGIADLLGSHDIVEAIGDVFESTERIIDRISPKFTDMLGTIIGAIEHSLPFVERFFGWIGDGMESFTGWLSEAMKTGDFERWLEKAFDIAKDLWDLAKSIGELLGAIFGGTADDGEDFIEMITEMVDKMTKFFESPEGKKWMQDTIELFKLLVAALSLTIGAVGELSRWWAGLNQDLIMVGAQLETVWNAISGFFSDLWEDIKGIGTSVGEWFKSVGQWFSDLGTTISEKGSAVLQWFQDLPGKISEWLSELPGKIGQFFTDAFDRATYAVGFGIGTIVRFFVDLPGNIAEALTTFWTNVTKWFEDTRRDVIDTVTRMWNAVVDWFEKLPGRVSSAVSTIVDKVSKWFRKTRDDSVSTARTTFDKVVEWFQKLPGRAADVISGLPGRIRKILGEIVTDARNIGNDIMGGIARGIENGWNTAIEAAKRAARNILSGFWDAFEIGSPSKLMARTVGKPIMQGIGVGIVDTEKDVTRTINLAVNRTVGASATHAESRAMSEAGGTLAGGGGITIQQLTIPITGTFDLRNPAGARAAAMQIFEALEQLKKEYR